MESAAFTDKRREQPWCRHWLAPSVQVRPEDSGLLFYCSKGPRLYFLNSGNLLSTEYFGSGISLNQWFEKNLIENIRHTDSDQFHSQLHSQHIDSDQMNSAQINHDQVNSGQLNSELIGYELLEKLGKALEDLVKKGVLVC